MADRVGTAYLVAGSSGMLGTAFRRVLDARNASYVAPAEPEFDITRESLVHACVVEFRRSLPAGVRGVLLNAAAYTNVERAEEEPSVAFEVNETGAHTLALAAREAGLGFAHVSTDFVFDGTKPSSYAETDEPRPLSVYGASKLAGEHAVLAADPRALVVRTAWVYAPVGNNFPAKILAAAAEGRTLRVVTDEVGSPTYAPHLAEGILDLLSAGAQGLYHLAGSGSCSRYDLACETLRLAGVEAEVEPVTSESFVTKAHRPANSVLDCGRASALGVSLPPWREGLECFIAERGLEASL